MRIIRWRRADKAQGSVLQNVAHLRTGAQSAHLWSGIWALPYSICRWQRRTAPTLGRVCAFFSYVTLGHYVKVDNSAQVIESAFKKPGIIIMWQRFFNLSSCYLKTFTRSYLRLPSFSVIGESQSAAEDNNLPSITILPTLVWLHKLSLSSINQESKPCRL